MSLHTVGYGILLGVGLYIGYRLAIFLLGAL